MKAMLYRRYGKPQDVLHLEEVDKPTPGDDDVLVRVRAASVNPMDCHFLSGVYIARPMTGLRHPKPTCPGVDMAGVVEAVGKHVTRFAPGDEVFGVARGSFAEYACTTELRLALKPSTLTFEQAAAMPVAGVTALQFLRDKAHVQPGQQVLVNGAAGGVGSFAVQIAKSYGASVTGVCSTRSMDAVQSIGADHVIDYTKVDFTKGDTRYDVIFDCAGSHALSAYRRAMTPKGIFLACGARAGGRFVGPLPFLVNMVVSSWFASQRVVIHMAKIKPADLDVLRDMATAGTITPVIDRQYTLDDAPAAVTYVKAGHTRGKVVLSLGSAQA